MPVRETTDCLALLRVFSTLVSGQNGRQVEASILAGEVADEDLGRIKTLAKELNSLVHLASSSSSSFPLLSSPSSTTMTLKRPSSSLSLSPIPSALVLADNSSTVNETDRKLSPSAALATAAGSISPRFTLHSKRRSFLAPAGPTYSRPTVPAIISPPPSKRLATNSTTQTPITPTNKRTPTTPRPVNSNNSVNASTSSRLGIDALPDSTLLYIFDMVWSGRPSYGGNDGRRQLGDIALVCRQWRDLANSDELWKPLCIARWPWLKSLKGGPAELLPPLAAYRHQGEGGSPMVWHEFCVRHGRCMNRAGIGRRTSWGSEYSLSVEIFDRKGGFRLFCSYGRVSIMQQNPSPDGRWLTKLAITGFASCWHFSASSRDPVMGRFENIRQYFERSHERGLEHCLCTEVTVMNKATGKMAVLYASSKETKRKLTAEKGGTSYFEEELRPTASTVVAGPAAGGVGGAAVNAGGGSSSELSYLAASGMAVSKVLPPGVDPTAPLTPEQEKDQQYRVDRLYLIFSTARRWDVNKIFAALDWA